jgi:hypothetical protein
MLAYEFLKLYPELLFIILIIYVIIIIIDVGTPSVTLQRRSSYTASGTPNLEHRFVEVGWGFLGVLLGS